MRVFLESFHISLHVQVSVSSWRAQKTAVVYSSHSSKVLFSVQFVVIFLRLSFGWRMIFFASCASTTFQMRWSLFLVPRSRSKFHSHIVKWDVHSILEPAFLSVLTSFCSLGYCPVQQRLAWLARYDILLQSHIFSSIGCYVWSKIFEIVHLFYHFSFDCNSTFWNAFLFGHHHAFSFLYVHFHIISSTFHNYSVHQFLQIHLWSCNECCIFSASDVAYVYTSNFDSGHICCSTHNHFFDSNK